MRRIVTTFGEEEFAKIVAYAKRKRTSLYGLAKRAIREFVETHP